MKFLDILKVLPTVLLLILGSLNLSAQKETHQTSTAIDLNQKEDFKFPVIEDYDGTYQFILKSPKNINIHKEILSRIKSIRKSEEDYTMVLSKECEVLILSEKKIKSKEFIPFKSPYIIR